MKSTLSHEYFHTELKGKRSDEEVQVIIKQMQTYDFRKTTQSFKNGISGYLQEQLKELYRKNNNLYNKYIEEASKLLKANGANGPPTYINGGNDVQF